MKKVNIQQLKETRMSQAYRVEYIIDKLNEIDEDAMSWAEKHKYAQIMLLLHSMADSMSNNDKLELVLRRMQ